MKKQQGDLLSGATIALSRAGIDSSPIDVVAVYRGPFAGIEGLLAPFLGVIGALVGPVLRKWYWIVRTDGELIVVPTRSRTGPPTSTPITRYEVAMVEIQLDGSAEPTLRLESEEYRVLLSDLDHLRRLLRYRRS